MKNKDIIESQVGDRAKSIGFGDEIRKFFSKFENKSDAWWDQRRHYSIGWWLCEAGIPGHRVLHKLSEEEVKRHLKKIYGENFTMPTLDK